MDLETILKRFYRKEFKVFKQNGKFTKKDILYIANSVLLFMI